jgi:uncharacterized protein YdeI (YjbR/CyaY-like superfamily)
MKEREQQAKVAETTNDTREIVLFKRAKDWSHWLSHNYAASTGVWLRLAKKASELESITYAEALEEALCYGWIDGQKRAHDENSWIQKFTPRRKQSTWSKINRAKVLQLIESGKMQPSGLAEIEAAQTDGRWDMAYDSMKNATVPADLQAALDGNSKASAFFATLKGSNRYAILFRIQTAKKVETRARRIEQFVSMLEKHETI